MNSFESPQSAEQTEEEKIVKSLKTYFGRVEDNDYYDDGSEFEMDADEIERIEDIVAALADKDFSPAYEYLEEREKELQGVIQKEEGEDGNAFILEKSKVELKDVIKLKESLIVE